MLCSNFIPTSTMGTSDRRAQTQFIVALWCLVVAVLTDPVPGLLGTAWGAATMIDDTSVNQAIESRLLMDPEVSAHLIDVDIHDGIASLSGKVGTLLEKERAISIAESIKGVRSVIDRIDVSPNARNDSAIQGDIEHTLRQDRVTRPYQVDVSVREGVVTLSGKVPSWGISRLAARAASRTAGVKRIVNQINVSTQTARRDSDIEKEVRNRLRFDLYVDDSLVDIKVENGEVSLSGIVGSAAERSRARRIAMINGVRDVDDEALAVEWRRANQMRKNRKYTPLPDQRVEKAVADALLYDPRINSANPDIHVRNGKVTLSGIVDNYEAKRSAEQDARNTAGVWRVQNRLKVRYQNWPQDDMVESNILRVFERDAVLGGYAIEAHVKNHLAVLTGVVDTMGQKIQAETIAGQVNGVVAVQKQHPG